MLHPAFGLERAPAGKARVLVEEIAAHERVLAAIDKETKGGCLWLAGHA